MLASEKWHIVCFFFKLQEKYGNLQDVHKIQNRNKNNFNMFIKEIKKKLVLFISSLNTKKKKIKKQEIHILLV